MANSIDIGVFQAGGLDLGAHQLLADIPVWTQTFSDSFTGTQYTNLPAYSASWAENATNGHHRISTNGTSAGAVVFASARTYLTGGVVPGNDQACQITLLGSSFFHDEGLVLRFTDGDVGQFWGGTGYAILLPGSGEPRIEVQRIDGAGSHTLLASQPVSLSSGDVLRAEMVGSILTVLVNGVALFRVYDTTYASGTVGLFSGVSYDDGDFMSIDDFVAEEIVAGAPLVAVLHELVQQQTLVSW